MRLPSVLRQARIEAGLSQRALGERVSTTGSAVAQWEAGHRIPGRLALLRICLALFTDATRWAELEDLALQEEILRAGDGAAA